MRKPLMIAAALLVCGCAKAPPPATLMTFEQADKPENNDKQIALEGYPRLPARAVLSDSMLIELHQDPSDKSKSINFDCNLGGGANQVEKPPRQHTQEAIKIHGSDGSLIISKDKIRVEGQLTYWIEKTPPGHNVWLAQPVTIQRLP